MKVNNKIILIIQFNLIYANYDPKANNSNPEEFRQAHQAQNKLA